MRFLLYNMRYGSGIGKGFHFPFPGRGYLRQTTENLNKIIAFIKSISPDIAGLIEIDSGSFRTANKNQAAVIAEELGHFHLYQSKYGPDSFNQQLPVLNKQGNALLANRIIRRETFHYFNHGIKKLVIEAEMDELSVFLVHLSLKYHDRQKQLSHLYNILKDTKKPCIVAGDFNAFWGKHEMELFLGATRLTSANHQGLPSYPSWAPKRQLDFILHSPEIEVTHFAIPQVLLSDHCPMICDFQIL